MTTIVFDNELIRQIMMAEPPVDLVDPQGKFVARVELFDNEVTREVRERLKIPSPEPKVNS